MNIDCNCTKCEYEREYSFLDDYSHINREFEYFHPKCTCHDECEFCREQSVLDALHGDVFDEGISKARGFAGVVGFIFGIR